MLADRKSERKSKLIVLDSRLKKLGERNKYRWPIKSTQKEKGKEEQGKLTKTNHLYFYFHIYIKIRVHMDSSFFFLFSAIINGSKSARQAINSFLTVRPLRTPVSPQRSITHAFKCVRTYSLCMNKRTRGDGNI